VHCAYRKNRSIAEKQRRKSTNGREELLGKNSEAVFFGTVLRMSKCFGFKEARINFLFIFLLKKAVQKFKNP
jgi:hypothetical protein